MTPMSYCFFVTASLLSYVISRNTTEAHEHFAGNNATSEKQLVKRLLSEYGDTSVRPVKDHLKPVEVYFRMLLIELINLDERGQMVSVRSNMRLKWTDEYLQWDPEQNGGIYNLTLKMNQVWRPDVVLDEDLDRSFISLPEAETFVIVQHTGVMDWLFPAITTSACKVNIKYFPFDTQKCNLTFYPWTLDDSKMRFFATNDEDALQERYIKNGIWTLTEFTPQNFSYQYPCCPYPNDHIVYKLTFQRESAFFVSNIVIPAIFLTALMLVGFWLHPDTGEKIAFSVTNLLALILFQQLVSDNMPPVGEPKSIIVTCFFMLVVLSGCAVFFSVLVLRLYHHDASTIPPRCAFVILSPWIARRNNKHFISKFYNLDARVINDDKCDGMNGNTEITIQESKPESEENIDERNTYLWRQLALAFDSFCGTVMSMSMLGTLLYALINFLVGM